jgi:hypothetical protein
MAGLQVTEDCMAEPPSPAALPSWCKWGQLQHSHAKLSNCCSLIVAANNFEAKPPQSGNGLVEPLLVLVRPAKMSLAEFRHSSMKSASAIS